MISFPAGFRIINGKDTAGAMNTKSESAFTLLELLIVIALIAILAALLLPALSGAKDQAAKTTDLNNFRQLMVSMHVYASENGDELPWPNWDYGGAMPDGTLRPGWLYTPDPGTNATAVFQASTGLLWNAMREPKSYLCPGDRLDVPLYSRHAGRVMIRPQQLSSYIMNGAVIGFRTGYHSNSLPVKVAQMRPGDCILFEGDGSDPWHFNDGSSWPSEGITSRHMQGATIAAMDGSSIYIRDDIWQTEVDATNKNSLWCYPDTVDGGDPVYGHVMMTN